MGVKQKISKYDLPKEFQNFSLIESKDGISDSVYLLGKEYVLKIYEKWCDEVYILSLLDGLKVPKVVKEFEIDGRYAVIFTQIEGKSSDEYPLEVVRFLKRLHNKTKGKTTKNRKLFTKKRLEKLMEKSNQDEFKRVYRSIDIELKDDGIIHGDLFPDNAKFVGKNLSGVYDFSEACVGDFYFDLAVMVFSFSCDVDEALREYGADIRKKEFLEYVKFAKLYYSVTRFLDGRDWKEIYETI